MADLVKICENDKTCSECFFEDAKTDELRNMKYIASFTPSTWYLERLLLPQNVFYECKHATLLNKSNMKITEMIISRPVFIFFF